MNANQVVPNPGSDKAVEQGCKCPVFDNHRGDPKLGEIRGFIVMTHCPLHALQEGTTDG